MSASSEPLCPICKEAGKDRILQSEGLVWAGVEALFTKDLEQVQAVYDAMDKVDGHVAIGCMAVIIRDLCLMFGADVPTFLTLMRKRVNERQAHGG